MKESVKKCRFCGKEIGIITCGVYRKIVVDAEAVKVIPAQSGETFVRIDGSKVMGIEVPFMEVGGDVETVYRMHRWSCGG